MISIIFAMDSKGTIGKDNRLPWHLPADLAYFKKTTLGHTVIMGRKTFESVGRPLPGRCNVIITRDKNYKREDCVVLNSIEEVIEYCSDKDVFIIGGADIYTKLFPYTDKLYITLIEASFEGDAFFPEINYDEWKLVSRTKGPRDEKNPYDYDFLVYERK